MLPQTWVWKDLSLTQRGLSKRAAGF